MLLPSAGSTRPFGRDTALVAFALIALAALAWGYTVQQATTIEHMKPETIPVVSSPLMDATLLFAMWVVMMVAMMIPAVGPMTMAFATINRRRREHSTPYVATFFFVAGYLVAWTGFSAGATAMQIALRSFGLFDSKMTQTSDVVSMVLFLSAGLYQWSSLKEVCLTRCRSTEGFILSQWRDGHVGAVTMGLRHGIFCIGCCIALMLLLFAGSVMDLRWVAGLTILVIVEKLLPYPDLSRRLIGGALIITAAVIAGRLLLA